MCGCGVRCLTSGAREELNAILGRCLVRPDEGLDPVGLDPSLALNADACVRPKRWIFAGKIKEACLSWQYRERDNAATAQERLQMAINRCA